LVTLTNPTSFDPSWSFPAVCHELRRFAGKAKGRRLLSRVEFAEKHIVLPEGPYEGEHWRPHFQPYTYHVLHLMDTDGFRKYRFTGCVQSGKTFIRDFPFEIAWNHSRLECRLL
jgi:hypothetical protein